MEGRTTEEGRKGEGWERLPETCIWEGGWCDERWWWALKMCASAAGTPHRHLELPGSSALSGQAEKGPSSQGER